VTGRTVVVGAGAAGLGTAEGLRAEGFDGEIVLVGEEPHAPYDRPPLSKDVLAGRKTPDWLTLRPPADIAKAGIDLRLGVRATGVDAEDRHVELADGSTLGYERLVVATGVGARRLPFGHEVAGVHVLRDLADTLALRADLRAGGPVVVVGAGFLGAEAAAVCRDLGHPVDLVDVEPLPMRPVLGDAVAGMLADLHRDHGVRFHPGRRAAGFDESAGRVSAVRLDDGAVLEAAVVIVAIGSVPATGWLGGAVDLDEGGGVRCDDRGRAAPGIWAVGDVAGWWDPEQARHVRVEHRFTANEHAAVVARDVCGTPQRTAGGAPFFWSDQYDLTLRSFGLPSHRHRVEIVEGDLDDRRFVAAYGDEKDRVVAVVGAGMTKALRGWRQAVVDRAPMPVTT
jgi:3-phenylpropionate/trans-cinnamate dioxygenase ferredoxin reductase component